MTICTLGYGGRIKEDILSLLRSADPLPGEIRHFHFPGFYYTTKMKINKNKTRFSSVSPAFVGPYVPFAPVSRAERQRCSRTALSEVTHDLWLSTLKAPFGLPALLHQYVACRISFSLGLFSYKLIMKQMKLHTTHRVLSKGATHRLLSKDPFRVSFYPYLIGGPFTPAPPPPPSSRMSRQRQVACRIAVRLVPPLSPGTPHTSPLRDSWSLQHRSHHRHSWPSMAMMQQSLQTTTR